MNLLNWIWPAKKNKTYLRWQADPNVKTSESIFLIHGHGSDAEQMDSLVLPLPPRNSEAIALRGPHLLDDGSRTWINAEKVKMLKKPSDLNFDSIEECINEIENHISKIRPNKKVHLVGYSLGASIVSGLILKNPEKYLSAAMCNGVVYFNGGRHLYESQAPPCFISTGLLDPILPPTLIRDQVSLLKQKGWDITYREYDAPHVVNQKNRDELSSWLYQQII